MSCHADILVVDYDRTEGPRRSLDTSPATARNRRSPGRTTTWPEREAPKTNRVLKRVWGWFHVSGAGEADDFGDERRALFTFDLDNAFRDDAHAVLGDVLDRLEPLAQTDA